MEVRAYPVIQAAFILGNGSTISQGFHFDDLTVPAGRVTRSSWNVSVPLALMGAANLTAYPRIRGPISEASPTYRVPQGRPHAPNKIKGREKNVLGTSHGDCGEGGVPSWHRTRGLEAYAQVAQ